MYIYEIIHILVPLLVTYKLILMNIFTSLSSSAYRSVLVEVRLCIQAEHYRSMKFIGLRNVSLDTSIYKSKI